MSDTYPVFVNVRRNDGSIEQVRVGSAFRAGEGFTLQLGDMTIGASPVAEAPRSAGYASAPAPSYGGGSAAPARSSGGAPTNFPNYGRGKNGPIAGGSAEDLQYYAAGCRRTLADQAKSRWHDKERELLAVIEAEMARQGISGGGGGAASGGPRPRPSFMDAPPSSGKSSGGGFDDPPPPGDDDIPF